MCITALSAGTVAAWLFGFAIFALIRWPYESFGERLANGLVIPTLLLIIGHLLFP